MSPREARTSIQITAHALGLPVLGHWGSEVNIAEGNIMTGIYSPATNRIQMTGVSDLTQFSQRVWNTLVTVVDHLCAQYITYRANLVVQVTPNKSIIIIHLGF